MKRVVVTGMGIVSCLGNDKDTVLDALKEGRSGIKFQRRIQREGLSQPPCRQRIDIDLKELIDRKTLRFMGDAAAYCVHVSMDQAIKDAGLTEEQVSNERAGIIMGSGGASSKNLSRSRRHPARKRPEASRPLSCHPDHGQYRLCVPCDAL